MSDPAGVSAQVQYVAAERRVNWYLDNMNIGWDLWTWRIKKDKQQQQQQAETAAGGKTLVPAVTKPDQPDDQLQQLLFKQHAGVFDWFVSLVLPDLELQRWLGGLYELLKVWTRPNVPGQVRSYLAYQPAVMSTYNLSVAACFQSSQMLYVH